MRLRGMSAKPLQRFRKQSLQHRANNTTIRLQLQRPPHQVHRLLMLRKVMPAKPLQQLHLQQRPHQLTTWMGRWMSLGDQSASRPRPLMAQLLHQVMSRARRRYPVIW